MYNVLYNVTPFEVSVKMVGIASFLKNCILLITMSFAVIKTGGKQYKVEKGDILKIEKLADAKGEPFEANAKIVFDEVLLTDDGKVTVLGTPTISGKTVTASVVGDGRHKKVMVVKYRPKSRYFKKNGHRQPFTEVKIETIS